LSCARLHETRRASARCKVTVIVGSNLHTILWLQLEDKRSKVVDQIFLYEFLMTRLTRTGQHQYAETMINERERLTTSLCSSDRRVLASTNQKSDIFEDILVHEIATERHQWHLHKLVSATGWLSTFYRSDAYDAFNTSLLLRRKGINL